MPDPFLMAAAGLLAAMVPCFWITARGDALQRLVGLEAASNMATVIFLLVAVSFNQGSFADLALTLALLSYGGGLVFARFLERWL